MSTAPQTRQSRARSASWDLVWTAVKRALYPYQLRYLTDRSPRKVWVASRQIGKSFTLALEASLCAAMGLGPDNLLVSHDQRASGDLLRYVRSWMLWLQGLGIVAIERETATEVRITGGCRVVAIPGGRPEAMRGFSGNVWLDEADHHADQAGNLQAAGPILSVSGGAIRVVSTPFSDGGQFWGIVTNRGDRWPGWTRHTTTIHDAIREGIVDRNGKPLRLDDLRMLVPDRDRFAAEYECVPLSNADSYFPDELLERCMATPAPTGGAIYGGFDVARSARGDMSCICSVRRDGERYACERVELATRGMSFEAQQDFAARAMAEGDWVRMAVDATGLGMETAERLTRKLGASRVDAVTMTSQSKADLMTGLRALMDQGRLALPDDRDLRLDLHAIKRIVGDSSIRYDSDRNERGHADRAWALALAVRAAGKAPRSSGFDFHVSGRGRSSAGWSGA